MKRRSIHLLGETSHVPGSAWLQSVLRIALAIILIVGFALPGGDVTARFQDDPLSGSPPAEREPLPPSGSPAPDPTSTPAPAITTLDALDDGEGEDTLSDDVGVGISAEGIRPALIEVEPSALRSTDQPCATLGLGNGSLWIEPVETGLWGSGEALNADLWVDWSTSPTDISWQAIGPRVAAVVVIGGGPASLAPAHTYDYRWLPAGLTSDGGLVAPAGEPEVVLVCYDVLPGEPDGLDEPDPTPSLESAEPTALVQAADDPSPNGALHIGAAVRVTTPLNLRSAAGTSQPILTVLPAGTSGTILSGPQSANGYVWWRIGTGPGTGWVAGAYLQLTAAVPPATNTATATEVDGVAIGESVITIVSLNLRSDATTTSSVLAVMPRGTVGDVVGGPQTGSGYTWWQIFTSYGTGWAAAIYLELSADEPPTVTTPTGTATATLAPSSTLAPTSTPSVIASSTLAPTSTGTATSTVSPAAAFGAGETVRIVTPLNLRTSSSTTAPVVTVMPANTLGSVLAGPVNSGGYSWWQLETGVGTGWAAGAYLQKTELVPTATATPGPTFTATLTSLATTTATRTSNPSPSATPVACGPVSVSASIRVNTDYLNLRSAASTSASIVGTMPYGTRGEVIAGPTNANGYVWCRVTMAGYGTGWVASQYLAAVPAPVSTPAGTQTPRPDPPADPGTGQSLLLSGGTTSSGKIALTFDAATDHGNAGVILDTLAAYGVRGSFAITGVWAQNHPDLIIRMVNEGHQIMNHGWGHNSFTGASNTPAILTRAGRIEDLRKMEQYILDLTGYQVKPYWRPAYGDYDLSVLRDAYAAGYYMTIMWTCDALGWQGLSEAQILNRCMYPVGAGAVILMHMGDGSNTWAAVDDMIEHFQAKGLQLVTIEEMFS